MSLLLDLFSDEISDFAQHVKPEEEINKYSTQDDLGEVRRAVHILKKGFQSQKMTIIENMHKVMDEQGANEEFLPIILSSIELWDFVILKECAKSFQKESVLSQMTSPNLSKLMEESVTIILNADITQEEYVNEWLKVFKALCPYMTIEYIKYTLLKRIQELPSLKQTLPWRKIGFDLFWSILIAKGEEILISEPLIMRTLFPMFSDNNWKIRRDAAVYLNEFLKELHKLKKNPKSRKSSDMGADHPKKKSPRIFGGESPPAGGNKLGHQNQLLQVEQTPKLKLTKERFKEDFYDLIVEIIQDQELLVKVEGIFLFVEYIQFITKHELERDFVPQLLETFETLTKDDLADDAVEIRFVNKIGFIADRLNKFGLLKPQLGDNHQLEKAFIDYFKACMIHPVKDVRKGAAYNLPCFYLHFRFWEPNLESSFNEFDDSRSFLDRFYHELCMDEKTAVDILVTLASGIHEVLKLFPMDQMFPQPIQQALNLLIHSQHIEVKEAIVENLDHLCRAYLRKEEQRLIVEEIKFQQEDQKRASEGMKIFGIQSGPKKQVQSQGSGNLSKDVEDGIRMGSPKRKYKPGAFGQALAASLFSKKETADHIKDTIIPLSNILEIDICPEEWQHEYVYSKFLDQLMPLINCVLEDKTKWRIQETLIKNLGKCLNLFNPQEIQDTIFPKIVERIKSSNEAVRVAGVIFIAELIHNQYKSALRQKLIDFVITEFAYSPTFALRKLFVSYCQEAVQVMSFQFFAKHFYNYYLKMSIDPVKNVRIAFLNSMITVRPYLEIDQKALNDFNACLDNFENDNSSTVVELASTIEMQVIKLRRTPGFVLAKAEDGAKVAFEQRLNERDIYEIETRVKQAEETKNNVELVTIYHFTNMLKKHKNPSLVPPSLNGSQPLTKKGTNVGKKKAGVSQQKTQEPTTPVQAHQANNQTNKSSFATSQPNIQALSKLVNIFAPKEIQQADNLQECIQEQNLQTSGILTNLVSQNNNIQKLEPLLAKASARLEDKQHESNNTTPTPLLEREKDASIQQRTPQPQNLDIVKMRRRYKKENNAMLPPIGGSTTPTHAQGTSANSLIVPQGPRTRRKIDVTSVESISSPKNRFDGQQREKNGGVFKQGFNETSIQKFNKFGNHSSQQKRNLTNKNNLAQSDIQLEQVLVNNSSAQSIHQNTLLGQQNTTTHTSMPSEVKHILWKNCIGAKANSFNQTMNSQMSSVSLLQNAQKALGAVQNGGPQGYHKRRISSEEQDGNQKMSLTKVNEENEKGVIIQQKQQDQNNNIQQVIKQRKTFLNPSGSQGVNQQGSNKSLQQRMNATTGFQLVSGQLQSQSFQGQQIQANQKSILPPLSQILMIRSTHSRASANKQAEDQLRYYGPGEQQYESQKRAQSSGSGLGAEGEYQLPGENGFLKVPNINQQYHMLQVSSKQNTAIGRTQAKTSFNMRQVTSKQQVFGDSNLRTVASTANIGKNTSQQVQITNSTATSSSPHPSTQHFLAQHNPQYFNNTPPISLIKTQNLTMIGTNTLNNNHNNNRSNTDQQQQQVIPQIPQQQQKIAQAIVKRIVSPKEFGNHSVTQILVRGK